MEENNINTTAYFPFEESITTKNHKKVIWIYLTY